MSDGTSQGKILIIIGDATETVDTLYPFYRLREGGYTPVVAAPEKRRYNMVMHEVKPGWTITKEWEGYSIEANVAFKDVDPTEYAHRAGQFDVDETLGRASSSKSGE